MSAGSLKSTHLCHGATRVDEAAPVAVVAPPAGVVVAAGGEIHVQLLGSDEHRVSRIAEIDGQGDAPATDAMVVVMVVV
jgi:hypothetical protein